MEYLIDPNGRWWRWPSTVLAEQLGYPDPDFDLAGYASRNLGYLWVSIASDMTLLQFRAGMLSHVAIEATEKFLNGAGEGKPVALVYFASGWMEEVFPGAEQIGERLRLIGQMPEPRIRELYIRREHRPTDWARTQCSNLSKLFDLWRERDGVFDEMTSDFLFDSELLLRTVLMEPNSDHGLKVIYSGAGFTAYDSFSLSNTVGRGIEEQLDKTYGTWARQFYDRCLQQGDPIVDDIDAIVEQPNHDPRRRRYQRLILRWQRPDGSTLLSGSSLLNPPFLSIPLDVNA